MINDELGTSVNPEYVENPIPEEVYVHDTYADTTKIQDKTSWSPQVSFEEGVRRVCEQYI
jgi:UDP-glucose 4-epimerase